jgi:hypothetical protein
MSRARLTQGHQSIAIDVPTYAALKPRHWWQVGLLDMRLELLHLYPKTIQFGALCLFGQQ